MTVSPLKKEEFDTVYRIMEASFPTDEYKPYRRQKRLLDRPEYTLYAARQGGEIIGFAAVWDFGFVRYIEHLAVTQRRRGGGIGGSVLETIAAMSASPLCLEVEPPDGGMAGRRVKFYQRHGFYFNDRLFVQPPLAPGQNSMQLYIMTYGAPAGDALLDKINGVLREKVYVW